MPDENVLSADTKSKHAPAPWEIKAHDGFTIGGIAPIEIVAANGEVIACNTAYYPTGLAAKNAPVIAAAPELLAAAKAYFESYCLDEADDPENCVDGERQHEAAKALQAAIAKAEGFA